MVEVAFVALAVIALCTAEAAKKSSKKEKATLKSKTPKQSNEKESKPQKRGLYPDPLLGSTYAIPGDIPLEEYHSSPADLLSVDHDVGIYGGVYGQHLAHVPAVAATYAPKYGFSDCGDIASHSGYTTYGHGYLGGFPGGLSGLEALLGGVKIEEGTIRVRTITTHVPVPVPHPVPVEVIKKVPVPVREEVPVDVPRAVRVEVPQPYPVEVEKPYPVEVPKPVPQPVPFPVHYAVPKPYPVEVPTPYAVEVHKPVPVAVPREIEVVKPVPVATAVHNLPPTKHVLFHTTPKPYIATPTVVPAYSSTPAPLVTVTKCDEDHGLAYPDPTSLPSFAKDIFSISSFKHSAPIHSYHSTPAPTYSKIFTPAPAYSTVTPIPTIAPVHAVTPASVYPSVVPITPKAVTKFYPTVAPVQTYTPVVTPVPAYKVIPAVPAYPKIAAPVYSTPAPVVAYPTPAAHVVPSYPSAPVYPTPAPIALAPPVPAYPKVVVPPPAYPTSVPIIPAPTAIAPVASYVTPEPCDHSYQPSNLSPSYSVSPSYNRGYSNSAPSYGSLEYSAPRPSYGYGSGVATSFVGMTSHGSSYGAAYSSEINHPQLLRQSY